MPTVVDLLQELVAGPSLRGAACIAEREVFDACPERGSGSRFYARAIRICSQCPALALCRDWVNSTPIDERPHGVTAGLVHNGRYT